METPPTNTAAEKEKAGQALLNKAAEQRVSETLEGELAILLHKYRCKAEHEDRCGWEYDGGYGQNAWEGDSHKEWLENARTMLNPKD